MWALERVPFGWVVLSAVAFYLVLSIVLMYYKSNYGREKENK